METPTKQSGIVTNADGTRSVAASVRADGSVRKEIKIRPGYTPPEDVEKYRNRTAESFRNRGKAAGVLGAELVEDGSKKENTPLNKNAKRREARKKAAAEKLKDDGAKDGASDDKDDVTTNGETSTNGEVKENGAKAREEKPPAVEQNADRDIEAERAKEAKKLAKKLRQARDLSKKSQQGESLIPEQFAKVVKINELVRHLKALGFDEDGEKTVPTKTEKSWKKAETAETTT